MHRIRWVFLTFSSITFFASEFVVDQISVLNGRLQGTAEDCQNGNDLDCLELSSAEFNGLFVAHFWAGGIAALCTGFFVGSCGVLIASCVSSLFLFVGVLLITIGPYFLSHKEAFAILLTGRIVFAVGYFGNITISHEVKSHWFLGKELGLAFALYMTSCRIGSVLTYLGIGRVVEAAGLQNTLWTTFGIAMLAPVASIMAGAVYRKYAPMSLEISISIHHDRSRQFQLKKATRLTKEFWILCGIIFCYFGVLFTFLADGPKFLMEMYDYSESLAGILTGAIPDVALLAPLFGYLIDRFGRRDICTCSSFALLALAFVLIVSVPVFLLALICVMIGISYAIGTASIWSSIPLVVSSEVVGVAMGFGLGTQAFSSGLMLLVAGFILDRQNSEADERWTQFFILLVVLALLGWILSGLSIFLDRRSTERSLRCKHVLPAAATEMNEDVNECTPLQPHKIGDSNDIPIASGSSVQ